MKCLDNFANIGKAAIIQSLGFQKNYTEVIETTQDTIDYNNVSNTSLILGTFNPMITWYAFPLIEHPCVPIALK